MLVSVRNNDLSSVTSRESVSHSVNIKDVNDLGALRVTDVDSIKVSCANTVVVPVPSDGPPITMSEQVAPKVVSLRVFSRLFKKRNLNVY